MRLMKIRYLTLSLLLVLVLGGWLARTTITEQSLEYFLRGYDLTDVTLDIRELGLKQSHVSHLVFGLATETGRFRLEFKDVSITYDPAQLESGRIQNLSIDRLSVRYTSRQPRADLQDTSDHTLEPFVIMAGIRQAVRKYIIFESFFVKHAVLNGDAFSVLQDRPLRLSGTNDINGTSAVLNILDPDSPEQLENSRQLIVSRLSENTIAAEMRQSVAPEKQAAAIELTIGDTQIDGSYTIQPDVLSVWLKPFADVTGLERTDEINGKLDFRLEPDQNIDSRITASTRKLDTDGYHAGSLRIDLNLDVPHVYPFELIRLKPGSFIQAGDASINGALLGNTRLDLAGDLSFAESTWQYDGAVSADALTVEYESRGVPLRDLSARVLANPGLIEANGGFSPANTSGNFKFTLSHDLARQHGKLSVTPREAVDLNTGDQRLSQLLTSWPYAFDILAGTIRLSANAHWSQNQAFRLAVTARLDGAGGHFDEMVFSGLTSSHELEILPTLKSKRTSTIVIEHVDSGVTASNISTRLTVLPPENGALPRFDIRDLRGEIFGGSFLSDDFVLDLNKRTNSFRITASDIDLAEIVETQHFEDIAVTGSVDGIIPIKISDGGVSISDGAFVNKVRAGTIRYQPAGGTDQLQQNPLTGIALDALRDFRYSHLSAEIDFTPEGMLTVNLQLKGTSPELETTRPVHLNINTEQNLFSLLKSLRYAEGISAKIDRKVRRQYQNQK